MPATLQQVLAELTMMSAPELVHDEGGGVLRCVACGHRCRIAEGKSGVCRVRRNVGGHLQVPAGYVGGLNVDPIEKKPFYHVLPGSDALSFGMLGCDFHCSFCQNWISSQTLRDEQATAMPSRHPTRSSAENETSLLPPRHAAGGNPPPPSETATTARDDAGRVTLCARFGLPPAERPRRRTLSHLAQENPARSPT